MKRSFTKLRAVFALLALFTLPFTGWGQTYTLVSNLGDLSNDTYCIAALNNGTYYTVPNTTIDGQTFTCTEASYENNVLTPATGHGQFVFTAVSGVDNAYYIYNTNLNKYLVATGSKKFGYVNSNSNDYGYWTFSTVSSGGFSGTFSVQHSSKTQYMRAYNNSVRCYDGANNQGVYFFVQASTPSVDAPTFSPIAGTYTGTQNVTISCATTGSTIYYTTDGSTPSNTSTLYTGSITVSATTTIKAIAYVGTDASNVVSATYTIVQPLTTMDAIFSAATAAGTTATPIAVTFNNWVVTGATNNNVYVTDGTKGFIIYNANHGFAVGNVLSGTASCKVQLFNGAAEITELTTSTTGLTVTTGGTVTPVTNISIADLSGVNTGAVLSYGHLTYNGTVLIDANNNEITPYNKLYSYSMTSGHIYNVTGVYLQYNTTKEILPRSANDIEEVLNIVEAPTFSPAAGTYAQAQTVTISCATQGVDIFYTTDGTDPDDESDPYSTPITVSETTTIKAIAYDGSDASYIATATYHINSLDDPYTVTQALSFPEYQYPANGIYVHGIVSTAPTKSPTDNGELTYYISVNGEATDQLEVYKGKGLNNNAFTAQDDIQLGDIVTVYGNVVIYGTTNPIKEFAQGNYLVAFEHPTPVLQSYDLTVSTLNEHINGIYVFDATDENNPLIAEGLAGTVQVLEGTDIIVSPDVEDGYSLGTLTVIDDDGNSVQPENHMADGGYYSFTMPSGNVTITATAFEPATYTLATTIESGKTYIIVGCKTVNDTLNYYAMGEQKNNNRDAVRISADGTTATSTAEVYEFIITTDTTDSRFFNIYDPVENGYLYAAGKTNSNYLRTKSSIDTTGQWAITFVQDTASIVANFGNGNANARNTMRYNGTGTNNLFACYKSENTMSNVYLYVKDETPTSVTQDIALSSGSNWVSFNVDITLDSLKAALVAALPGTQMVIKAKNNEQLTYTGSKWKGNLASLDVAQMYMIQVASASTISVVGMPLVPADHPVTIVPGANWIAFPFSTSMTPTEAFAGFAITGDVIKNKDNQTAAYNGTKWKGSLTTLEPGKGYIFTSSQTTDRTFIFPTGTTKK